MDSSTTNANAAAASNNDLTWAPRPDREVLVDDLEWGCVIRGDDGGYTTIEEAEDDTYFSEFGCRRLDSLDKTVTVVADDDIMSRSRDMRGRSAADVLRFIGEEPPTTQDWHFRINQLFLWGFITSMRDWDAVVATAETTEAGRTVLALLHRPLDEVRLAVEDGLTRHTSKNGRLGVERRLYRVNW